MKIGERIKQRRLELHMSAGELGSLIGKNRATVYRYESGDIESISLDMLDPLAEALSVTPEQLMGWCDNCNKDLFEGVNVDFLKKWHKTFGENAFTEDEHLKIMEYAKFLMYLREK